MSLKDRLVDFVVAVFNPNGNRRYDAETLSEAVIGEGALGNLKIRFMSGDSGVYCIVEVRSGFGDRVIIEVNEKETFDILGKMIVAYNKKGIKVSNSVGS